MTNLLESVNSKATAIAELAKLLGNPELKLEIADLKMELANLKTAYTALQDENTELKNQCQEDIDNPLTISKSGIYFDTNMTPFCTGCYDGHTARRVHLAYSGSNISSIIYICPVCKTEYKYTDDVGFAKPIEIRRRQSF